MAKVALRAYNREIEAMIDRNHLDEAIAHCKHILKTFPKHLETYRLLGKAYLEYKRYPEAVDIFSRVLVAVPNDFVSNVGMSIIRDEENKLDDAIWHMERAFETQPSNAAIQSELQRLYARRDGVQVPRIRMTHGALANMYVKGELYPQAISEIKSVLKEDPGRNDMQALLARTYYRSGAKNDAAEVASALLRSQPYSLEANRILVELLGADHPESVQAYRQRVVELDPYAAQVSGSILQADEVPDVAVSLERLDWNGQPVGMQPDWQSTQAISLESEKPEEEPDWLRGAFGQPSSPTPPLDAGFTGSVIPPFEGATPSGQPAEPADDIPDFLRAAGWGQSTGAFDESKSAFAEDEPASAGQSLAPGELPDWVKAMAPEQTAEPPTEDEDLPDWINKIGTSALPVPTQATDQPDWMKPTEEPAVPSPAQAIEDEPDWLKQMGATEQPAASSEEQPDWLKGFENESATSLPDTGELSWLNQLSEEAKASESPVNEFDFLDQTASQAEPPASTQPSDGFDFLRELEKQPETTSAAASTDDFDFLNELADETEQLSPASASAEPSMQDKLGMSAEEQDDSFAWLESLAAKQGATEGLLTKPEDRLEEEPGWIKQAKGQDVSEGQPAAQEAAGNLKERGKSEQEQEDSFAWLENLAARQGATEGLLTKPEERLEEEPEWVRQARTEDTQPSARAPEETIEETPIPEQGPSASLEDLGKSQQEQEDSFAWLENLAAKQGATEGFLTQPEERREQEPEWVRQAKELPAEEPSMAEQPERDTDSWLQSLDAQDAAATAEPASTPDDTMIWFKNLEAAQKEVPPQPAEPVQSSSEDLPAWMQNLEEDKASETVYNISVEDIRARMAEQEEQQSPQEEELPAWMQGIEEDKASDTDLNIPALEATPERGEREPVLDTRWMSAIDQPSMEDKAPGEEESKEPAEELPSWLSELDQEKEQAVTPTGMDADLPAWLRDETGELVAEPTRIEPTRATDWQPARAQEPEPEVQPAAEPEPVMFQSEVETPQAEAPAPPEAQRAQPEVTDVVSIIEEKIAAVQEPVTPAAVPPAPPRERRLKGTGRLSMPLDPVLGQARNELSGSHLSSALESYSRLIKKGRFLEEVIYDLREASYRFPVDVDIWQSLGDAYMRANRLQDALDAYTKAEELLR